MVGPRLPQLCSGLTALSGHTRDTPHLPPYPSIQSPTGEQQPSLSQQLCFPSKMTGSGLGPIASGLAKLPPSFGGDLELHQDSPRIPDLRTLKEWPAEKPQPWQERHFCKGELEAHIWHRRQESPGCSPTPEQDRMSRLYTGRLSRVAGWSSSACRSPSPTWAAPGIFRCTKTPKKRPFGGAPSPPAALLRGAPAEGSQPDGQVA